MRRDYINIAILWFVLTTIAELLLPNVPLPIAAAEEAGYSDEAFRLLMVLGVPVFTFTVSVLAYSLLRFRARGDTLEAGAPIRDNVWISGLWLLITGGLCFLVILHPGLTGLSKFFGNPTSQLVVKVTGRQYVWDIEYPAQKIAHATEVVLPVGQRVKFEITAADVMHSVWIPAFRHKMDAVPGLVTAMYVTPTRIGSYEQDPTFRIQCAELCGSGHALMKMPVRVVSPAEFEAWVKAQAAAAEVTLTPVQRGAELAKARGCTACHSLDGSTIVGPTWKGLYGSRVELADGTTVTADDAYLRESIINPNAKIVKGFQPIMPPLPLTEQELSDLIEYIKSIK